MAYVCFIVDAFSRMIVGWTVASHMRTEMVLDALEMARHSPGARRLVGLATHSDAGSQGEFNRSSQHLDGGERWQPSKRHDGPRGRCAESSTRRGRPRRSDESSSSASGERSRGLPVHEIAAAGTTVLLTTQYLGEADQLAERIAVIDGGRIVAEGTSAQLKAKVGSGGLHVRVLDRGQRPEAQAVLGAALDTVVHLLPDPHALSARLPPEAEPTEVGALVCRAMTELSRAHVAVAELALGHASLDEAFLALTGRPGAGYSTDQENANQ